ncbi:type IV secretion system protein VirD4 [Primorskyibacter sedentarius]|uniref:Type IV secretion system protein VirD4 n=1 Tax=Primorskyibacter sedentarius TaxID=745311 RepID=A0A4R3IYG8_9RHOB|nr:type IV secretory system conjugative DNA transfer family protein [Primorskyibacter sedentarius]TCS57222.1 type IV secretion system protein VirD4 [Primorskyibacter sedentarius]
MRLFIASLLAVLCGLVAGSVLASVYLTVALRRDILTTDLLLHYQTMKDGLWSAQPYLTGHFIVAGCVALFLVVGVATVIWDRLVSYGQRRFQSLSSLRRNKMVQPVGYGFVLGEQIPPPAQRPDRPIKVKASSNHLTDALPFRVRKLRYIAASYSSVSNVLMVAPTRSGKGVGFVIPNALTFPGSMVVLDVKGELWDETARAREQMGDKVFRFAPLDFKNPTHQYNPLARLSDIEDMEELWTGLERIAQLFLQSDGNQDWLEGSILLFVAAGILAVQRGNPTMGEIYRIIFGTGQGPDLGKSSADLLHAAAKECQYPPAARELSTKASLDPKIQQSYISILSVAGLAQWANPKVERVTRRNDFDFTQMRREPTSVYLMILSEDMQRLNSLVRLFFADLISFLRSSKPGEDEPLPIFMLLDEFDQLGRMPLVVQAMKQTAGHGGRFAIVTQSIPGLITVPYSPEEIQAIESACQVKLYIAASEDRTASELETALGTRTGSTRTRTEDMRAVGFGAGSLTRSTEHRPLLSKQEIRDMDPDKIIILPERQDPILADRIKYYESREILKIHKAQDGYDYPYPKVDQAATSMTMTDVRKAARDAKAEEDVTTQAAIDDMAASRSARTADPLHRRAKQAVKRESGGKMSPEGHAALLETVADAQDQLKKKHGPEAA